MKGNRYFGKSRYGITARRNNFERYERYARQRLDRIAYMIRFYTLRRPRGWKRIADRYMDEWNQLTGGTDRHQWYFNSMDDGF